MMTISPRYSLVIPGFDLESRITVCGSLGSKNHSFPRSGRDLDALAPIVNKHGLSGVGDPQSSCITLHKKIETSGERTPPQPVYGEDVLKELLVYAKALCFGIPTVGVIRPEGMVQISQNRSGSPVEGESFLIGIK
jgi:hypothetical protein